LREAAVVVAHLGPEDDIADLLDVAGGVRRVHGFLRGPGSVAELPEMTCSLVGKGEEGGQIAISHQPSSG
jgi:hypothetical protein